jgi:hypothetical protein
VVQRLMRTGLVVEAAEIEDEARQVLLAEDEDVIEQLATERTDEPRVVPSFGSQCVALTAPVNVGIATK